MVICLERGTDLHMAQLMPLLLTVSCFSKIQMGFTFLVPAHPGSPGKRAVKRVLNGVGLLFSCLKFFVAPLGSPGSRCPRFIELNRLNSRFLRHCTALYYVRLIRLTVTRSVDRSTSLITPCSSVVVPQSSSAGNEAKFTIATCTCSNSAG